MSDLPSANNTRTNIATNRQPTLPFSTPIDPNDEDANIRRGLDVIQSMIDISANRLEGLRTQCATSAELTQQEIRSLESKLVRMFTDLLMTKAKLPERLPSGLPPATEDELRQWLRIVGLSGDTVDAVLPRCGGSLESLLELDDGELRTLLQSSPVPREEETRRMLRAMANLRRCRQLLVSGDKETVVPSDMFWDSWDRHHHTHHHHHHGHHHHGRGTGSSPRPQRAAVGAAAGAPKPKSLSRAIAAGVLSNAAALQSSPQHHRSPQHQHHAELSAQFSPPSAEMAAAALAAALSNRRQTISPEDVSHNTMTPSPSPPSSPSTTSSSAATGGGGVGGSAHRMFPTTPPPRRKLQTAMPVVAALPGGGTMSELQLLTKSKSHESQLLLGPGGGALSAAAAGGGDAGAADAYPNNNHPVGRSRLHTEPSPDNYNDLYQPGGPTHHHHHQQQQQHHQHYQHHTGDIITHTLQVPRSPVTPLGFHRQTSGTNANTVIIGTYGPGACALPGTGTTMQTSTSSESSSPPHGHRFTKRFKVMSTCDLCGRPMFFGLKCKECKYRCHKDCEPNVSSTCVAYCKSQLMQQADVDFMTSHSPNLGLRPAGAASLMNTGAANAPMRPGGIRDRLRSTDFNTGSGIAGGMYGIGGGTESGGSAGSSSCNSSTPSSPALMTLNSHTQQNTPTLMASSAVTSTTPAIGPQMTAAAAGKTQFKFPEVAPIYKPDTVGGITLETHLIRLEKQQQQMNAARLQHQQQATAPASPRAHKTHQVIAAEVPPVGGMKCPPDVVIVTSAAAVGGGATVATSAATATTTAASNQLEVPRGVMLIPTITKEVTFTNAIDDPTATNNSEASSNTDSDRTAIRLDSADDPDEADDRIETDGQWSRQNSVSLKEWDIPFEDINLMEKIGDGRFGTVHRAQWHGAVAIKILKEDYLDNEAFKVEVATFKKTRHENVVLFMGACIRPQAIVTSLCKGNTLYTHIHVRKDKFNLNKTTLVAQQISLGMGYLHARNITHKDLKTKNIFLENGKVIITDFGLFSATKLEYDERQGLRVPFGWLAYLAPEIMQQLQPRPPERRDALPFSSKSDIYAFGTVWYELLSGEFPFKSQAPEAVIFQVGRGMKQTLANLQTTRDVKEILMTCWSFDYNLRPDFSTILQQLEKLPKKRLVRSPSHPVHLSRSAESVF